MCVSCVVQATKALNLLLGRFGRAPLVVESWKQSQVANMLPSQNTDLLICPLSACDTEPFRTFIARESFRIFSLVTDEIHDALSGCIYRPRTYRSLIRIFRSKSLRYVLQSGTLMKAVLHPFLEASIISPWTHSCGGIDSDGVRVVASTQSGYSFPDRVIMDVAQPFRTFEDAFECLVAKLASIFNAQRWARGDTVIICAMTHVQVKQLGERLYLLLADAKRKLLTQLSSEDIAVASDQSTVSTIKSFEQQTRQNVVKRILLAPPGVCTGLNSMTSVVAVAWGGTYGVDILAQLANRVIRDPTATFFSACVIIPCAALMASTECGMPNTAARSMYMSNALSFFEMEKWRILLASVCGPDAVDHFVRRVESICCIVLLRRYFECSSIELIEAQFLHPGEQACERCSFCKYDCLSGLSIVVAPVDDQKVIIVSELRAEDAFPEVFDVEAAPGR
jgi:hypothetical protein